ncbi:MULTISPECIES: hypothetical protein [unclassified Pseudoalteromonas]|uniref:hypothetical protein n=1 Tax=unclassified Pseudoalteromonas TaxID=194690 RepID=UPI0003F9361D|nr:MULTISPECIES: hypothetical protein [unclassified Pseudoalteromonas]
MYLLNIQSISEHYDFHTLSVPFSVNETSISGLPYTKIGIARRNKVNRKTGVRALGSSRSYNVVEGLTVSTRAEAEEAILNQLNTSDEEIQAVLVTPKDHDKYWLLCSAVRNPLGMIKNIKESSGIEATLIFIDTLNKKLTSDDLSFIKTRLKDLGSLQLSIMSNVIRIRVPEVDAEIINQSLKKIGDIVLSFNNVFADTKYVDTNVFVSYC